MEKQLSVKAVCQSCGGTGLYEGFCEPKGHPVVCLNCEGSGCSTFFYTPFVERKKKNGVKGVSLSRGTFILTGVGKVGEEVTYEQFLNGKLKYKG